MYLRLLYILLIYLYHEQLFIYPTHHCVPQFQRLHIDAVCNTTELCITNPERDFSVQRQIVLMQLSNNTKRQRALQVPTTSVLCCSHVTEAKGNPNANEGKSKVFSKAYFR